MRFIYIHIRETIRAITSKAWSFAGSVLTVFLAALLAGSFALLIKNTGLAVDKLKAQASVEVYLKADIDSLTKDYLHGQLVANRAILGIKFISKEIALQRLKETFGADMVRGITSNPLPSSYELTLEPVVYEGAYYQKLVDSLRVLPGVDDVGYVPQAVSRLKSLFTIMSVLGLLIGILVVLACGFIIGNTIGVSVANRHLTFYVMRLVGSQQFVRAFPLFIHGAADRFDRYDISDIRFANWRQFPFGHDRPGSFLKRDRSQKLYHNRRHNWPSGEPSGIT
jgi:cell division protein FtsX